MRDTLADDPWHKYYAVPDWLQGLIDTGALGQKTRRGVYRKTGKEIHVLDLARKEYMPSAGTADNDIKELLKRKDPATTLASLRANPHPQAQFLWAIFRDLLHYCAVHLEAIADNARDLDFAMRWGFGWNQGPFETWQAAGWTEIAEWINEDIAAGKSMSAGAAAGLGAGDGAKCESSRQSGHTGCTQNTRFILAIHEQFPVPFSIACVPAAAISGKVTR